MRNSKRSGGEHAAMTDSPSWITRFLTRHAGKAPSLVETLESRMLLAGSPLPTLADLESPGNTVVRIETTLGDIDIELFNGAAPVTVANFLNYVTSGRFDETFFHRSALDPNPFVLQGGGFIFDNTAGLSSVSTDAPIIRETTGRSNVQRTVAMARTGVIDSATSQFFINYVDNLFLDPTAPNNGFAVFGQVITDAAWNVVLEIQALISEDLTAAPEFAGPDSGNFGEVPIIGSYNPVTGVRESLLVNIINAEIIKPAEVDGFYSNRVIYPEGFRSTSAVETLELLNPNAVPARYQVIAHYEVAARDTVIASGEIGANSKIQIRLSDFADASLNLVRIGAPYALFVESALPSTTVNPQAVAAALNRFDFNGDAGEAFFNPAGYTDTQIRTWDFPRVERNSLSREFITWTSLSDETATITTTFITDAGGTTTITSSLDAYRRGGLDIASLGLTPGTVSVRVTSTQPIVAALSDYDLPASGASPTAAYLPAFGVLGIPGGGTTRGSIATATFQTGASTILSFMNPGSTVAVIIVKFWTTGRSPSVDPIQETTILAAGFRRDFAINSSTLGIPVGESFTVTYDTSALISAQYTQVDEIGRNQATGKTADGVATAFSTRVAPETHFADGRMDPSRSDGSETEKITIFNPFANGAVTYSYTVRYSFSDGSTIDGAVGTLTSNGRVDIISGDITAVRSKVSSGAQFRTYGITVIGSGVGGTLTTPAAGIVMLTRFDSTNNRSVATTGLNSAIGLPFTDPVFGTNGGVGP